MRFILKLLILAIIGFVLYHFFGPQIDAYAQKAKNMVTGFFHSSDHGVHDSSDEDRKYYPVQKRTQ